MPILIPSSICLDSNQKWYLFVKVLTCQNSSTAFILPYEVVKLFTTPWTSMSLHTFLPLSTLILLAGKPFWKLRTSPIPFSWADSISPMKTLLICAASLQGQVVHSSFCINTGTCTYYFYSLYDTSHPCTHPLKKNNKPWLWVRHCNKCKEPSGEKDTGRSRFSWK